MKKGEKKGLSTVVITLIIILISLVAVGIVWVVVRNVIQTGTKEVTIGQFSLSAKIKNVFIDNSSNNVSFTVKRNAGQGEFSKLNFVFYDGKSSEIVTQPVSLNELEEKWFMFHLSTLNVSELISISIFPYVKQDEKEILGNILDKYTVSEQTSTIQSCIPLSSDYCSTMGYVCGDWGNGSCSGNLNCGPCAGTCNASGKCIAVAGSTNNCTALSTANTIYTLISNVNSSGTCFTVTAQNVILDCAGHNINYSQGGGINTYGVYTNQLNTTIKNCNVYDGNWTSTSSTRYGIYYNTSSKGTLLNNNVTVNNPSAIFLVSSSNNNILISNTATSIKGYGIVLSFSDNNILTNNKGISNTSQGIILSASLNNTLTSNTGISNTSFGISLGTSSKNTLTNNIGKSDSSYAISISSSPNNTLTSNTGISNSSYGISIDTFSGNSTLINNTGISNSGSGIYLVSSSNCILTSNTGTSNTGYGINLLLSSNCILTSNTGTSNSTTGILLSSSSQNNILINNTGISDSNAGISLFSSSDNNTLINCTGISDSSYGIRLETASNNNFYGLTAISYFTSSTSYGIYISTSGSALGNNLFQDCINITGAYGDVYLRGTYPNQTFINCSYRTTGLNETVGVGAQVIRKWYYRAYVNNTSGNGVSNVNVSARNNTGNFVFSGLFTNSSGWTSITTIIDYVNNGTMKYYSNYNISAANTTSTKSHLYNVTSNQNNLKDVFTF